MRERERERERDESKLINLMISSYFYRPRELMSHSLLGSHSANIIT